MTPNQQLDRILNHLNKDGVYNVTISEIHKEFEDIVIALLFMDNYFYHGTGIVVNLKDVYRNMLGQ